MTITLCDLEGNVITNIVNDAILNPDIIKIKNRLLDGTYHIQTIGNRIDTIKVDCYVDKINKDKIDSMYVIDEPIKLLQENKYYIGLIDDKPDWETVSKQLYLASFKLVISQSGVV